MELEKEIADSLAVWFGHPLGYNNDFFYEKAKELLQIIHKYGYGIPDDKAELPDNEMRHKDKT